MAADMRSLPMVVFLFISACFNMPFFVRSIIDTVRVRRFSKMPAAPAGLLTTSFAELCWVLPCLVQCALQLFNGDGDWTPASSKVGCDVMGFYSVFGSVAGMTSTLWVALMTERAVRGGKSASATIGMAAGVAIVLFSALFAALPFMGVGQFTYTGEGFCYFDFHDEALATLLLLVTAPTVVVTIALLAKALRRGGWPSQLDLYLMGASFLSAWTLWVPACIMGLAGATFPAKFFISGGVMGHAQALINPYVYGLRWRRSVLALGTGGASNGYEKPDPMAVEVGVTPSQTAIDAA